MNGAGYQLTTQQPVMAIGGFNGTDPAPTLAQFKEYVRDGRIHYFIGGSSPGRDGRGSSTGIANWVEKHYTKVTAGRTTLYDLTEERE